jgi:hypothetical protein
VILPCKHIESAGSARSKEMYQREKREKGDYTQSTWVKELM